jgi:hypothetical protein
MARTATGVEVEDTRRRAPKVGARAPQTLSGSDARWNDERPVVDPAVRTSLGGGRGEAYQRNATDNHPRVALITPGRANIYRGARGRASVRHADGGETRRGARSAGQSRSPRDGRWLCGALA